jgi:hypothetical protein
MSQSPPKPEGPHPCKTASASPTCPNSTPRQGHGRFATSRSRQRPRAPVIRSAPTRATTMDERCPPPPLETETALARRYRLAAAGAGCPVVGVPRATVVGIYHHPDHRPAKSGGLQRSAPAGPRAAMPMRTGYKCTVRARFTCSSLIASWTQGDVGMERGRAKRASVSLGGAAFVTCSGRGCRACFRCCGGSRPSDPRRHWHLTTLGGVGCWADGAGTGVRPSVGTGVDTGVDTGVGTSVMGVIGGVCAGQEWLVSADISSLL